MVKMMLAKSFIAEGIRNDGLRIWTGSEQSYEDSEVDR